MTRTCAYRRNGVLEGGVYLRQQPGGDGLLRSGVFPGLWLDVGALLAGDLSALRSAVERGCGGDGHAAFARRLRP
ncbi:MAG: hypothetical protein KDC98_13025 [Planctomycetes bacterium]|nr:hypothetical protein [Planctomycetota bacterium]